MIEKVPPDLSRYLICPMPGLLTALHVGEGDKVEAGQPLAVVEAMKMENILRAEKAGHGQGGRRQAGRQPRGRRGDPGIRMNIVAGMHGRFFVRPATICDEGPFSAP